MMHGQKTFSDGS